MVFRYGYQKLNLTLNLTGVSLSLGTGCVPSYIVRLVPCVLWALMGKELPGRHRAGPTLHCLSSREDTEAKAQGQPGPAAREQAPNS